jgi:ATP-dependent DNA ligase
MYEPIARTPRSCVLGCEGIVSKRLGSPYRAGRTNYWLKIKNPAAPAVHTRSIGFIMGQSRSAPVGERLFATRWPLQARVPARSDRRI